MEDYIYILDFIPYSSKYRGQAYAQGIGGKFFTLLEVSIKTDKSAPVGAKIYVGKDFEKRDVIDKIKRRISYDELTTAAKENLPDIIKKIVMDNEERFVRFINTASPFSVRVHQLELLPGVGKKNIEQILEERDEKPFESFDDIKKRVSSWQDPIGSFVYRILEEIQGKERHYFFVLPQRT